MPKAVGFDLDGTLFDDRQYVRAGLDSAAAALEEATGLDLADAFHEAYFDDDVREETFDTVLAEHGLSPDHVPRLVDAYHDNDADLTPFPGAVETLETLAGTYDLGLLTGGHNGLEKLDRLGLAGFFDAVVVTSGGEYTKHDPEPFEALFSDLAASPSAAVYVGDRPGLDCYQPKQLGAYTVRVETGQYAAVDATAETRPDATIAALEELPALLAGREARTDGD